MNRIHERCSAIDVALAAIPPRIRERANCHWLIGADPVFVGLHDERETSDGRLYKDWAHCSYGWGQSAPARCDRVTTVVLPKPVGAWVVVHEFGHVLHEALGFEPECDPVTEYAQRNQWEAFAEALTAWMGCYPDVPSVGEWNDALFRGLARA